MNSITRRYERLKALLKRPEIAPTEKSPIAWPPVYPLALPPPSSPRLTQFTAPAAAYMRGLRDGYKATGASDLLAELDQDIMEMDRLGKKFGYMIAPR